MREWSLNPDMLSLYNVRSLQLYFIVNKYPIRQRRVVYLCVQVLSNKVEITICKIFLSHTRQ